MKTLSKVFRFFFWSALLAGLLGGIGASVAYFYIEPTLPSIEALKDVRMQVPLRVYTRDGELMGEFGEMKRSPLAYQDIPPLMIKAVLAAEDERFFEHPGVDIQGLLRAAINLVRTGQKGQGGSTITMQVARNFFLTREKTYTRKLTEILLALKIDHQLSKEDILDLYLNKIYLGHRAYGVAMASKVYYGKDIHNLGLAQLAMIAGLPKAPSTLNPVTNPTAARIRRDYVLGRMHALHFITDDEYNKAMATPITASLHVVAPDVEAPYIAEMARAWMVDRYGNDAYTAGYKVYTTTDAPRQQAANKALRSALEAYDQRHGYRGPEGHVDLPYNASFADWDKALSSYGTVGGLIPALVVTVDDKDVIAYSPQVGMVLIEWDGLEWARRYIDDGTEGPPPAHAADILKVGDIVRIELQPNCDWRLAQVPTVGGALVSLRPKDGAILALIGGFDFFHSNFNRVTQAERQPGSSFKPFVYSAALNKGFTAATMVNDAPVVFQDSELESAWRPENYSGHVFGPTRLRVALIHSRNLVSIRVLRAIGIEYAINYVSRFGFPKDKLPRNLSLALGSASLTPLELARGYAAFANGGFLVDPYFITRVEDSTGKVIYQADPVEACPQCTTTDAASPAAAVPTVSAAAGPATTPDPAAPPPFKPAPRIIGPRNAYIMTTMMQDVIRYGTGRGALVLGRHDLAGKTGTTNEQVDAWFSGFNPDVVATAWVGFDTPRPLGNGETGAHAALPMWIDYMRAALRGVPDLPLQQPPGIVTARIDPETGKFTTADNPKAIFEVFRSENVPANAGRTPTTDSQNTNGATSGNGSDNSNGNLSEQLF